MFYWAYPGVDTFGRTNMWQIMDGQRGAMLGILPAAPKNHTGGLDDYMSPSQRWVVTPNNDTIYGAGFADLTSEAVVIQTQTEVPDGHYWTIQIVDVMTNVCHQLGSASGTPGGTFGWSDLIGRVAGRLPRRITDADQRGCSVAAEFRCEDRGVQSVGARVLNQLGMYPLSENQSGQHMIAANPEASRPDWVKPNTFRDDLAAMLDSPGMLPHLKLPGRCKTSLISAVVTAKPGRRAERIQVPATSAHTVRGSYCRPQLFAKIQE